ncbi:unnamed protein product [Lactuca saligna]|uniref:Uncharacterized protein n=1 Tax=Lactuca saligna TaxID=75948 RepID=A0AA35YDQ6_LACSI|nr:unnamed protein product [Lactuca saligna]
MLEEIGIYVMERLYRQKIKGSSWGDLNICPAIRLKLSKIKQLQRFWRIVPSGYQQFEVRLLDDAYVVDLHKRTCGCRGKVKVELVQEVDVESDSDSEVQREPDSEVESYEVDFEVGNHTYEDVYQPEVEAEVRGVEAHVEVGGVEEQVEVEAQVEAHVEVEVEEGEYQAAVVDQVEVEEGEYQDVVVDQVEVEVQGQGEGQECKELVVLQDLVGKDDQGQAALEDPVE